MASLTWKWDASKVNAAARSGQGRRPAPEGGAGDDNNLAPAVVDVHGQGVECLVQRGGLLRWVPPLNNILEF